EPGRLKLRNHFSQRHPECLCEMLKLRRTEPVNIDVWIFFADVLQKIGVPFELQFWMMPALHQDLHSACSSKFVQFLVDMREAHLLVCFVLFVAKNREKFEEMIESFV